ncbi:MAG: ATP phosphoribosyltransferase regulatory subunit, partial [Sphingobium sp.]
RGGSYSILRDDGSAEPAVGFSIYPDPLIDAGFGRWEERRLFLPVGHDAGRATALRGEGWVTVAALSDTEDGRVLGCGHWLKDGAPVAY